MATLLQLLDLQAGGFGSGCTGAHCGRPKGFDEALANYGWKPLQNQQVHPNVFENRHDTKFSGHIIKVAPSGRWRHTYQGEGLARDRGLDSLKAHLGKFHNADDTSGDESMPEAGEGKDRANVDWETMAPIHAGGPGSGCRGSSCGRPIGKKTLIRIRKILRQQGFKLGPYATTKKVLETYETWKKTAGVRQGLAKDIADRMQKAKENVKRAVDQGKVGDRIKPQPHITIDVKPVWKGRVKRTFVNPQGHQVVEIKEPKRYGKQKGTWVNKPNRYKGQFSVDTYKDHKTYNDPNERNSFYIHQATPDKAVSVEVHKNLGKQAVNIIERTLGDGYNPDAIVDHREVTVKNMTKATAFMNRRYGITI
jgi:hypothetical protein